MNHQLNKYLVIDFDSTFIKLETLEELARISLENNPEREKIIRILEEITAQGMEGKITFRESLTRRLALISLTAQDVARVTQYLASQISESFVKNKDFINMNADKIIIISGGFKDIISPIVRNFGIKEENIIALNFIYGEKGNVIGVEDSVLLQTQGKSKAIQQLKLTLPITVIGDGYTDYEIKEAKIADEFYAFVENIQRDAVCGKADKTCRNLEEVIYYLGDE